MGLSSEGSRLIDTRSCKLRDPASAILRRLQEGKSGSASNLIARGCLVSSSPSYLDPSGYWPGAIGRRCPTFIVGERSIEGMIFSACIDKGGV